MNYFSRRDFISGGSALAALACCSGCVSAQRKPVASWPSECDPKVVGKRVAGYTALNQLDSVNYPTVCCIYGLLLYAKTVQDLELIKRIETVYAGYLSGDKDPAKDMNGRRLEHRWFGIVPLELGIDRNPNYRATAKKQADLQEVEPIKDSDLYYVDAMYGVGVQQSKAFQYFGETKYAERCVAHLLAHVEALQQANGLFHHSERGRQAWGRGNGWAAASMTEALLALPRKYPRREQVFNSWKRLMDAAVKYQDAGGLWHQIVDRPASWLETSCTAMFVFALATGIREKWIPETPYLRTVEQGWKALASSVDAEGKLGEVCIGLGDNPGTEAHYLSCPRKAADKHGQGPFLWAAHAMMHLPHH